jgi:outer membrane protein
MPVPFVVPFAQVAQVAPATPAARPEARLLSLDDAVQTALRRQPQVRQARAATSAARARVEQAGAPRLPTITGTATYLRETGNFAPRPGTTQPGAALPSWSLSTSYNYWNAQIGATQMLYDFGQTPERHHAAEANAESSQESERGTEVSTVLAVRRAYFGARAQRALVKVADETLANQERHLVQIRGFVTAGTRPEIDLVQSRTDVANARVALIQAQNGYDVARAQLAQAMGIIGGGELEVGDDDLPPVPEEDAPTEQLVQRALAGRPELVALERQRRAQESTVAATKGAYGPTLAATATVSETGVALDGLVPNWAVGATLTWPMFQGGLTRGQVHEAEANLDGIDAQAETLRLSIRYDVENARLSLRAAKATIGAAEEALTNARERLRLAEGRYAQGVGSAIELGDAQVAASSAAAQLVSAQYGLATARAQLLAALGRK